jgi:hypothetical protein
MQTNGVVDCVAFALLQRSLAGAHLFPEDRSSALVRGMTSLDASLFVVKLSMTGLRLSLPDYQHEHWSKSEEKSPRLSMADALFSCA